MHYQHVVRPGRLSDRVEVAQQIERKLGVDRRHGRHRHKERHQCVAVGGLAQDLLRAHGSGGACPVLHDDGGAQHGAHPLDHDPRNDVDRSSDAGAHDQAHRLGGIGLGMGRERKQA
jgi:hypothetical protein